ncbi:MAG: chemotaxis response regulator protein-glutamate methylesterase [Candidatus Dactylopiibacterium carminicum]|uniref:Protein-glutamate methylesterase/protein-glutamine glutaminase n=1 Tax=Candidatus Dactylopiibacterium carminicum TaxID=857335 RepID=A0A272EUJ8_9RHOO|nr:chemotaxis response regulator protein-glutamate methylesterase [Candidatus Dactylopiibacterium carminicum]KAF7600394.1 chemotaxis response regulator protein-glutamate methylesterase [Candidatus Dactylopiibacterium carminicum]PAS93778.1 MAG: chemotaxis response regulator protein-glutamate methylesterase [Candidatus Dactylopiibacterium carminicum]PAS96817.1 MAG: chemotaxis response regulator protein-glutamate methylesterase [Candidatus Dactylopiibacterium carminicum]PAT00393.1 MAG: chemotaxis 
MIKVLIVDDSALIRQLLTHILSQDPLIRVVGTASDPYVARDKIKELEPDVLTLDIEMPRMDGLEFLDRLMRLRPMPVIMISTLTEAGADVTLRALELGAVDYVTKPVGMVVETLERYAEEIIAKVKMAAQCRLRAGGGGRAVQRSVPKPASLEIRGAADRLILLGASTGGTEAIKEVLKPLPPAMPPIIIVQHMPPGFTASFARRLDSLCRLHVKEGEHGERPLPGHAYIAPGGRHMVLTKAGGQYMLSLNDDETMNLHRPAVDKLFMSALPYVGSNAIGVLLTGMGKDGARGLLALRQAGVHTVVQDEESCVVWGMPREAAQIGAADAILPLSGIADHLLSRLHARASA